MKCPPRLRNGFTLIRTDFDSLTVCTVNLQLDCECHTKVKPFSAHTKYIENQHIELFVILDSYTSLSATYEAYTRHVYVFSFSGGFDQVLIISEDLFNQICSVFIKEPFSQKLFLALTVSLALTLLVCEDCFVSLP